MKLCLIVLAASLAMRLLAQVPSETLQTIEDLISDQVRQEYADTRVAHRDAHAKHHGCVHATFQVNDQLASDLKVGPFQPGKSYAAWIRYSNGAGQVKSDREGDGRGMAVKLIGVPGPKLLEEERNEVTQDFLMINYPVFFVRNASEYVDFTRAVHDHQSPFRYFFPSFNPFRWNLHEARIGRAIQSRKVGNPLEVQYWSMVPYRFGNRAMKYTAKPCFSTPPPRRLPNSPNYLREAMAATLAMQSVCFEFFVQLQGPGMPIEDPTIVWDEKVSPPRKVATITIPAQKFDSDAQQTFCENLSYTPWHSVPELEPLGEINEVRKTVYQSISRLRHRLNGAERHEPTGNERF